VYETSDGRFMAVGAIEPQFYRELLRVCELDEADLGPQMDSASWPSTKDTFRRVFLKKSAAEWAEILEGRDACVSQVMPLLEAADHPHNAARATFIEVGGLTQPAPAPRFDRTPAVAGPIPFAGEHTEIVLQRAGLSRADIESLRQRNVIG
jgi:alpha-methylacyl-CoA racemase